MGAAVQKANQLRARLLIQRTSLFLTLQLVIYDCQNISRTEAHEFSQLNFWEGVYL
jgi:hypothetical protein